ncbi:GGDEF domain-containing protein [Massilia eurypsychrophila]|jgi:diguanylate cyclase (GGDEF)-like protein/PAS domain S-box-containing protein|uniref:GGDEF domain-containing protein n=1 Tax=Massilia eurypsychrophila TaxID=1485217 RepID=A0A2G8TDY1_9BURK|nr:EAL domain-containing protein [Massilia eurypsychrophila]PIL44266.1 GGDEF domain-containing protein [Massilia eurypsychrophila]
MAESALDRCVALARAARSLQGTALAATLAELEAVLAIAQKAADVAPAVARAGAAELALDLAGYLTGWNSAAEELFGYTCEEALGRHALFLESDSGDDPDLALLCMEQGGALVEVSRRKKSGDVIRVAMSLSMIFDDGGEAAGMRVQMAPLAQPLSEQDKVHLHARIIEDSDQGVLITDARERIVSINGAFTRITGYTQAESIGQTPDLLRSGVHDAELQTKVRAAMQGHGPWRGEIVGKRKNGELFPQSVTISVVRDAGGEITHTFSLFSDITVHKDAEARMQRMANYDSLTGLPNRSLFNHLVDQMLSEARRDNEYGALLVIEVDRIGAVSDTLGHDIASQLLSEIGRVFRLALRDADILARIDGSKFAVALPRIEKREHAGIVAQKLLATLAQPIVVGAHSLRVGAHIGIGVYLEDSTDTASLMRFAEVAMAKVEPGSDDRFLFYSEEMDQRAKDHLRLETELRAALADNQLELHYQPKVSLRSGRIVGCEALVRWRHPERGMVSPAEFIPLAEETGLIFEIGGWVLEEACRQIRAWKDAGLAMPPVAVNLSARQFDRRLPSRILAVLDRHGVLPQQIMLEITESLLVGGADNVIAIMNELVAMGLALALDDFGTGYSSLAYLKKFPISTLKIDRSFVIGLPDEENDCAIARAIVTMAQQLRQEIVAEGVETPEQMAFLRDLGCDQLQGYLFSPAVTAVEFARMLRDGERLMVGRATATA